MRELLAFSSIVVFMAGCSSSSTPSQTYENTLIDKYQVTDEKISSIEKEKGMTFSALVEKCISDNPLYYADLINDDEKWEIASKWLGIVGVNGKMPEGNAMLSFFGEHGGVRKVQPIAILANAGLKNLSECTSVSTN